VTAAWSGRLRRSLRVLPLGLRFPHESLELKIPPPAVAALIAVGSWRISLLAPLLQLLRFLRFRLTGNRTAGGASICRCHLVPERKRRSSNEASRVVLVWLPLIYRSRETHVLGCCSFSSLGNIPVFGCAARARRLRPASQIGSKCA